MAAPSGGGKRISCDVCGKAYKALKRCKNCKSTFYCSKECQIHDWPTHKLKCLLRDQSIKEISDHQKGTEAMDIETAHLQNLTLDLKTRNNNIEKQTSALLKDVVRHKPPAEQALKETKGSILEPADLKVSESSTSTEDCIKDPVTIVVKTSSQKHRFTIDRQSTGASLMVNISRTACIPLNQMKLIHKGKLMNSNNIQETVADRAVFQAIGEVAENDEGLSAKDIECVMVQIKVDRNTAIKALRQTGSAIDAILYLGNK